MEISRKIKMAGVGLFGTLVTVAPGVLASDTTDLVNDTSEMITSLWPLLILLMVISLMFGVFGGLLSKARMK